MGEVASPSIKDLIMYWLDPFIVVSFRMVSAAGTGGYHVKLFYLCREDLPSEVSWRRTLI